MTMSCKDVMKRNVKTVGPHETVEAAARRMRDANVGFLPVNDELGSVQGTITDRDIAMRIVAEGKPLATRVSEVMTREAVTCRPDDELVRAEELMGEQQKSRIMVVDDGNRLVGVISLSDIAEHEQPPNAAETLRKVAAREAHA